MKRSEERRFELEQRLAAGDDDIAAVTRLAPGAGGGGGKRTGRLELASIRPDADEIGVAEGAVSRRSEEHTSELQSLMRISYAVFCLKQKKTTSALETSKTPYTHHNILHNSNKFYI